MTGKGWKPVAPGTGKQIYRDEPPEVDPMLTKSGDDMLITRGAR